MGTNGLFLHYYLHPLLHRVVIIYLFFVIITIVSPKNKLQALVYLEGCRGKHIEAALN